MKMVEDHGFDLFGSNLFEHRYQKKEPASEVWIVEKETAGGERIQYRVEGKEEAGILAANTGGIVIGPEEKVKV